MTDIEKLLSDLRYRANQIGDLPADPPRPHPDASLMRNAAAEITRLTGECSELQQTNRDLHRRTQEAESRAYKQAGRMQRKVNRYWKWHGFAIEEAKQSDARARKAEAERDALLSQLATAKADGMREAATICKKFRNLEDTTEDQAVGALECALRILDAMPEPTTDT